jgi:glycosyltransferase involved in cell wall biosynthesis
MNVKLKILLVVHGHPEFSKGGGEIAAYNLFKQLGQYEECEVAFLAFTPSSKNTHIGTPFAVYSNDGSEILFSGHSFDYFLFSQTNARLIWHNFREFLESFKPDIVHFHHYVHLGLEFIREVRNFSTTVPIIMTLHEYLAICHNNGQMIKKNTTEHKLCEKYTPLDCYQCFPDISPSQFKMRELYIKSFFNLVDLFISPSQFLIERYVTWGLPREKMLYLENGQPEITIAPFRQLEQEKTRRKFAYFGQLNPYKGILLLLKAILKLPQEIRETLSLNIHGSSLEWQTEEFRNSFQEMLNLTKDCVRFLGAYKPQNMPEIMANVDWVVVPSIWWENSPLVIQEAFIHKRPVLCSNIGGMAEKVKPEYNGLHFQVNDPSDLAKYIIRAATEEGLWDRLSSNISPPPKVSEVAEKTLSIYVNLKEKLTQVQMT